MKVLTWNVQWFMGLDGIVDVARVIRHARNLCDFDVLCLQEVGVNFQGLQGGGPSDQAAAVALMLPDYEVIFTPSVSYRRTPGGPRETFGNLIATRLPAQWVESHSLPHHSDGDCLSMRRSCTTVLVQARSGPVMVMNTHLEYHSANQRKRQFEQIQLILNENRRLVQTPPRFNSANGLYRFEQRTARAILCGDFNCKSDSLETRPVLGADADGALVDTFDIFFGEGLRPPTFGCHDQTYVKVPMACDHVWTSEDVAQLASRFTVDTECRLSDHQPVWVEWEAL